MGSGVPREVARWAEVEWSTSRRFLLILIDHPDRRCRTKLFRYPGNRGVWDHKGYAAQSLGIGFLVSLSLRITR